MRKKYRRTLEVLFKRPTQSDIKWDDIEALFAALDSCIEEREGSRVYVELNDVAGHFHRTRPDKEAGKGAVDSARRLLMETEIKP